MAEASGRLFIEAPVDPNLTSIFIFPLFVYKYTYKYWGCWCSTVEMVTTAFVIWSLPILHILYGVIKIFHFPPTGRDKGNTVSPEKSDLPSGINVCAFICSPAVDALGKNQPNAHIILGSISNRIVKFTCVIIELWFVLFNNKTEFQYLNALQQQNATKNILSHRPWTLRVLWEGSLYKN